MKRVRGSDKQAISELSAQLEANPIPFYAPNSLYGLKFLNFGTSLPNVYAELIRDETGMICYDKALGGATIRVVEGSTDNLVAEITNATETDVDFIIMGGTGNDSYDIVTENPAVLGSITSGYADEFDTSTFCGALEESFKLVSSKWPSARKIFVTSHRNAMRLATAEATIIEKALEACKKWSIPVVDMYNDGIVNSRISDYLIYFTDAGTHLTNEGHLFSYVPRIIAKMKELIGDMSDYTDYFPVVESSNAFVLDCGLAADKNFAIAISDTNTKTITLTNMPTGRCQVMLEITATANANITYPLNGHTVLWSTTSPPTIEAGKTYQILFVKKASDTTIRAYPSVGV